jgi:hypothetical protein
VPVWHELSKSWREQHDLVVLGIAQEQHPERCDLFARWQGFDWPILWDPFNLTEARAVPNVYVLDEAGIVRSVRPSTSTFEADFLLADLGVAAAAQTSRTLRTGQPRLVECADPAGDPQETAMWDALSSLVFANVDARPLDDVIPVLRAWAQARPDDARARFRLGVALRMRYDSASGRSGDFQAALDAWSAALAARPNEYIWRRRIQQYGPALDKPYPFYDWVEQALADLAERGDVVPDLSIDLTEAERALPRRGFTAVGEELEPDPDGALLRDDGDWLQVEGAVAFQTGRDEPTARVHVAFRPVPDRGVHWNNEVQPLVVWFGVGGLPEGWSLDRRLVQVATRSDSPVSTETRRAEVELRLPPGARGELRGYALFYACEDAEGLCTYLRRDFSVAVSASQ